MANVLYYNLNAYCSKINQTDPDEQAEFSEVRDIVILANANDYYFSIIRFTLQSNNIPILIPKIQTGQDNVNLCTYGMVLNYNNGATISDPCYLQYVQRNKYMNTVVASPANGQSDSQYYYIFNIQDVVDMFNACSSACMANLKVKNNAITSKAPFMVYNDNNTFSIYYDQTNFGNNLTLCFNDDLYNLFRNFNCGVINGNGFNYQMIVSNKMTNSVTIGGTAYYLETQNFNSMQNWSPVQSIVFFSQIGTLSEYVANPQVLNTQSRFGLSGNNVQPIVTDIILPIDNPCDYNSFVMYNANVYREAEMNIKDLRNMTLQVFWKAKNGNVYPIMLSDGDNVTAKIKLQKKRTLV